MRRFAMVQRSDIGINRVAMIQKTASIHQQFRGLSAFLVSAILFLGQYARKLLVLVVLAIATQAKDVVRIGEVIANLIIIKQRCRFVKRLESVPVREK